jgi:hypothetical protein
MPWVIRRTRATSVIDVGCGTGAWLSIAKKCGCGVYGVDGNAPTTAILIDPEEYEVADISQGISCDGYDLAICLEVGEHLPEISAGALVAGLTKARYVFWSAAVPGQRGVQHINEQWCTWWEDIFCDYGYVGSSDVRRVFWDEPGIAPFYRQNFAIYGSPDDMDALHMKVGVVDEVHPGNPHIAAP